MRTRLKKWARPYIEAHPERISVELKEDDLFLYTSNLYMEIGSGRGAFALAMAPRLGGLYLALERDVSMAATLARSADEQGVEGIKVIANDFDVVSPVLKDSSVDRIFLNFSDPWPKKKHAKRRLTYVDRLKEMGRILKKGGEIRFKTDNLNLYQSTLENIREDLFEIVLKTEDYAFDEVDDVMSEYERRFREQNHPICRIILRRR